MLCVLPGFAAPGGRCGLAPVLVPWLWPVACLSGVPRGPALVHRASSGPIALGAPVGVSCCCGALPHRGVRRPRLYWVGARGTWRAGKNRALCTCRWALPRQGRWARSASYLFGAPRWGCPWRVPPASVFGCVRCGGLACGDPVTDRSGFPYCLSFDWGLGRCTGAVSRARKHLSFQVGGSHARVPRVCACACFPGRVGQLASRALFFRFFQATIMQLPRPFVKDEAQAAGAAGRAEEAARARPTKPVAAPVELDGEKRLPEGALWRWEEPRDEACRMGGTGWYLQVTIIEKEGGPEGKTNLTLLSDVWVGGGNSQVAECR